MLVVSSLLIPLVFAQQQETLPEGPGVDLVYGKCQTCHPINYVTDSAGLPDFLWADTLELMKQLGMQVTEAEEQKMYEYLTTYLGTEPPPEPAADARANGDVDGEAVYAQSCAACHGTDGAGTPGTFPPLNEHAARLAAADRAYLPLVVLYGVSGELELQGEMYNGVMPGWGHLSDDEIAAVLNVVAIGRDVDDILGDGFTPYTSEDIEAARGLGLTGADVHGRRPDMR